MVGPVAGWNIHKSVEDSLDIIRNVLKDKYTFAICLKEDLKAIGSVGLMFKDKSNIDIQENEVEIGYWIGREFWGRGLVPEACEKLIKFAFDKLNVSKIWCGYFDGNTKSKKVQEKLGFKYQYTLENVYWPLTDDIRTEHVSCLCKEDLKIH